MVGEIFKKKLNFSYKKTKLIPKKPPTVEEQELYVGHFKELCKTKDTIVIFYDPVHQLYSSMSGNYWQKKGKKNTKTIRSTNSKKRITILGGINPVTKDVYSIITESNCDKLMVELWMRELKVALEKQYGNSLKKMKTHIIMDNASYNKAKLIDEVAGELNFNLIDLPSYAPNLNLIERLWKFFKKEKIRNKFYETYDEFMDMILDFFKNIRQDYSAEMENLITLNFEIIKAG